MSTELDVLNIPMSEPKRKMAEYSWTIYGVGGFGKSGLASMFPDALFFAFEAGQNALRARKLPIANWKEFKTHVAKLVKAKQAGQDIPYKNFIIDTSDVAWKYCMQYVMKLNGWSHPSDAEWGKGWQAVADEWFTELDNLIKLGTDESPATIINILHDTDKEFKPKGKEKFNKMVLNIPAGGRAVVYDKVDFVIHCSIETYKDAEGNHKEKRVMRFRDNGEVEAKSRISFMPESIEFGASKEDAFDRIKVAFDKAIVEEFGEAGSPPPAPKKEDKKAVDAKKAEDKKAEEAKQAELKKAELAKAEEAKKAEAKKEADKAKDAEPVNTDAGSKADDAPKADQAENAGNSEGKTLEVLRKEVEVKFMELYKSGAKAPVELVALVEKYTGKKKVTEIDDAEKAQDLLTALLA